MRIAIAAIALVSAATLVHAQAPAPAVQDDTAVNVLKQQRNEQADIVVMLASRLGAMERELNAAREKLASCKPEAKPAEKK